jgi:peptidoglycan/LPS O-acetylase OafA/YrhL
MLLAKFTCHPVGLGAKLLNSRPLVAIGLFSYSLYLWQQEFSTHRSTTGPLASPTTCS